MTNDLNDHFWEEGGREKRKTVGVLPSAWPHGTCDGIAGNGGPAGEEREKRREKKLELENLGTSAGYGYLPVAQARYRELQRARQGIYHLQPGFARLGILYHTGTHIFLQRFRQTEHG